MTMDRRLQAWLDGELAREELPEALQGDAGAWTALLDEIRDIETPGADAAATGRIMAALRATAARPAPADDESPGPLAAIVGWWLRPRPIRISPLAAAAVVALLAWSAVRLATPPAPVADAGPGVAGRVYVQFLIAAPEASSVALAGDFNEWNPTIELTDPDGDGVWTGRVALETGVHEYMFVIDGSEWRPDPNALSYTDDGFGQRNSVLAVAPFEQT